MKNSTETDEKEIIEFYKKLNPDFQYITFEAMRLFANVNRAATNQDLDEIVKQTKWVGLLEQANKDLNIDL